MTDLTPNPAREKWELNKETAERAHKSSDKFILEGNKAVLTNAETVVRSLILINGGAAISVMTFVGALAARPSVPGDQISAIARGLEWFAGGALAAVLTAAFAYLTNYLYMSTEQKKTRDYERPYLHENEASNRRLFGGTVCHYLAVAFVILSLCGFAGGIWFVSGGVTAISARVPTPTPPVPTPTPRS
jgi:hypothetical protein